MSEQLQLPAEWWQGWATEEKPAKIMGAGSWTNAGLMVACRELGFLDDDWAIIDPTYGRGTWWTLWCPTNLVAWTRDTTARAQHPDMVLLCWPSWDFRHVDRSNDCYDAAVFDPPYCAMGGRTTTNIDDMTDHYGMDDAPATPKLCQELINDGLTEMARIVVPSRSQTKGPGILLVKCMNYVSGGKVWPGVYLTTKHAVETLGLRYVTQFDVVGHGGPQPGGRQQRHPVNNTSTLLVFRTPRKKKT